MEDGEIFTPLADITAPSRVSKDLNQQLSARQPAMTQASQLDSDKAKKIGEVHFKASHGIVVAFFSLLL